jgi:type IV secretion system protein VirB10
MDAHDRDKQLSDWEKGQGQEGSSLFSKEKNGKNWKAAVAIAVIGLLGCGVIFITRHNSNTGDDVVAQKKRYDEPELAARRQVPPLPEAVEPPTQPPPPSESKGPSAEDLERKRLAEAEAARLAAERKALEAKIKSPMIAAGVGGGTLGGASGAGESDKRSGENEDSSFMSSNIGKTVSISKASTIGQLEYKILQGKIINVILDPRIISDLPGQICGVTQNDVHGAQGREKLIPWGSQICGTYRANIRKGQERVFIVWNQLRRPDGVEIAVDSGGTDQLGTAGMGGDVDNHYVQIFFNSFLLSILGAGSSTFGVNTEDNYNSEAFYRQEMQRSLATTSNQVLSQYTNIPPTITVPHGARAVIYVNRDLDFSDVYKEEIRKNKAQGVVYLP